MRVAAMRALEQLSHQGDDGARTLLTMIIGHLKPYKGTELCAALACLASVAEKGDEKAIAAMTACLEKCRASSLSLDNCKVVRRQQKRRWHWSYTLAIGNRWHRSELVATLAPLPVVLKVRNVTNGNGFCRSQIGVCA